MQKAIDSFGTCRKYLKQFKKKTLLLFQETRTVFFHLLTWHTFCYWSLMDPNLNKEIGRYNSTRNTDWLCLVVLLRIQPEGTAFCSDKTHKLIQTSNGQ